MTGRARIELEAERRAGELRRLLGEDLCHLRVDGGVSQGALSRAAHLSPAAVSMAERGLREPTFDTLSRLAIALGADISVRLVPGAGIALRDRLQAPMVEALLATTHPRWTRHVEVAVRTPARGSIDVVLAIPGDGLLVAVELVSQFRRLEQLLRWAGEKAAALPATSLGAAMAGHDGRPLTVSRLLVVRSTESTRGIAVDFSRTISAAYPARSKNAVASLRGPDVRWPGAAVVWMSVSGGRARLLPGAARGVGVGR